MFYARVKQGEPAAFVGRAADITGNLIKQALISSISVNCYDMRNGGVQVAGFPQAISIAATVSDSLQQDPTPNNPHLWPNDTIGYNFLWVTPQTMFPNFQTGQFYRVEFEFSMTSGLKFTEEVLCDCQQILAAPLP